MNQSFHRRAKDLGIPATALQCLVVVAPGRRGCDCDNDILCRFHNALRHARTKFNHSAAQNLGFGKLANKLQEIQMGTARLGLDRRKGADYKREEVVGRETVEARGGRVVIVPLVEGRSTTNLIEKIRDAKKR